MGITLPNQVISVELVRMYALLAALYGVMKDVA